MSDFIAAALYANRQNLVNLCLVEQLTLAEISRGPNLTDALRRTVDLAKKLGFGDVHEEELLGVLRDAIAYALDKCALTVAQRSRSFTLELADGFEEAVKAVNEQS